MFGKLKTMAMKRMIASQLKQVPEKYQAMIMEFIENNPELCQKLALAMKGLEKKPQAEQQAAGMKVFAQYQNEIAAALTPEMKEALSEVMGGNLLGQFKPDGTINR